MLGNDAWLEQQLSTELSQSADLVAKLGIKILPSEDLKSRKILYRLDLAKVNQKREQSSFSKVTFGGPLWTIPELFFEKKHFIPALQHLLLSFSRPAV